MLKIYLVYVFIASALTQTSLDPLDDLDSYTNEFTECMEKNSMDYLGDAPISNMVEQWMNIPVQGLCVDAVSSELCPLCKNRDHCFKTMVICSLTFCGNLERLRPIFEEVRQVLQNII
ncbi:uncharacterized protein LOC126906879 [Daktulosphaira vitifoliae]|uniref:uncharacterized protein LOC126906879 n=1 Tax=Daktulosphaira vitifoliae TaxID=58002 RepID=UPI0021A99A9C|nr:uncharacterized protein LOC126906879 [Daktulosphaira vitifoliae]